MGRHHANRPEIGPVEDCRFLALLLFSVLGILIPEFEAFAAAADERSWQV